MHILIANNSRIIIPVKEYGGTERHIWWLGKELVKLGHEVSYLVAQGSSCPFAKRVLFYDPNRPVQEQIPDDVDFVHLHFQILGTLKKPYVITHHGNFHQGAFDLNTIFVSRNHAMRHQSTSFVFNGMDPDEYGEVNFDKKRQHLLFLAYAKRPEKNLKDCVHIAYHTGERLAVIGGRRRFDHNGWAWWVNYYGKIDRESKNKILNSSKALLFPVLWHEPCALTLIEALYFGLPVFGTTYGCLPDLIPNEVGFLSNSRQALIDAVKRMGPFNPRKIHDYACDQFSVKRMTQDYLKKYEIVLNGQTLNLKAPRQPDNYIKDELLPMYP
ncbi:MAG: glycosyltransferase [Candidatus Omnitrophica bacterium]|nr:glycosyltransferase [Candidatus Omnitrophota bacterium]